ncbi:hypothetical protein OH460_09070 [Vibrio sp. Makdt]|uniref:hypothetical protein n=1 Tax=Vibrio sp. Makdt TaxID=2998828 RepID=UPI0022CD85D5|nr:hypothetical protein [Vibrio sp. Makdt]MDA0152453.1 hypothetical protein [Vibrio sp. Makdt]
MSNLQQRAGWKTLDRGSNENEYQLYLANCDDGSGIDILSGKPLKSFVEWLNS